MAIGGSGTQADPWTIGSASDLVAFAGSTSYWATGTYACLTADIDMTGVSFTPIGSSSYPYGGTFDGCGYAISNLTISSSNGEIALFGRACGGTIQNVGCKGFNIAGSTSTYVSNYVGALVAYAYSPAVIISNCYAYDCTIKGSKKLGGLVGNGYTVNISNCYTYNCKIVCAGSSYAGGLIGWAESSSAITNCYVCNCTVSSVSYYPNYIGGLAGVTYCGVSNCAIYGGTHGSSLVYSSKGTITNCYTSNNVSSTVFYNQDFWNANTGGSLSQTYLSWDFTTPVWYWDSTNSLPVLQPTTSVPAFRTKVSGSWKDADKILVKVNGSWKEVSKAFVKVSGAWKEA